MEASALEIIHIGVTIALAVIGALVIQPLRVIRDELSDVTQRLAYIEGQMRIHGGIPWQGDERRRDRR